MYSQCPACATLFRVPEELPVRGQLRVRCGMCAGIFDPRQRYAETLPRAFLAHVRIPRQKPAPRIDFDLQQSPVVKFVVMDSADALAMDAKAASAAAGAAAGKTASAPLADWHLASTLEIEQHAGAGSHPAPRGTGGWVVGILAMLLVFVAQVSWFQRHELAVYPEFRPWLEAMCDVSGCDLPLRRDPDRIRLLHGQVTDHPEREGALVASATLENNAGFRQPYPLLKLSLLDHDQNVIGERWFHPDEYLDDPVRREAWQQGMPPQQAVGVRFALRDPGSGSAQYVFDYH